MVIQVKTHRTITNYFKIGIFFLAATIFVTKRPNTNRPSAKLLKLLYTIYFILEQNRYIANKTCAPL